MQDVRKGSLCVLKDAIIEDKTWGVLAYIRAPNGGDANWWWLWLSTGYDENLSLETQNIFSQAGTLIKSSNELILLEVTFRLSLL